MASALMDIVLDAAAVRVSCAPLKPDGATKAVAELARRATVATAEAYMIVLRPAQTAEHRERDVSFALFR
jgi:hypothetical protein